MHDDWVYARLLVFHLLSSHSVIIHEWYFTQVQHIQVRPEWYHEEDNFFATSAIHQYYEVTLTSRIGDEMINGYYDVLHWISHNHIADESWRTKAFFSFFYWDFRTDFTDILDIVNFKIDFNLFHNWSESVDRWAYSWRHYFKSLTTTAVASWEKDPNYVSEFDVEAKEWTGTSPITYDPDYLLRGFVRTFPKPLIYLDSRNMEFNYLIPRDYQYAHPNLNPRSQFDSRNFAAQRNPLAYSSTKCYNGVTNTGVNFLPNFWSNNVSRKDVFHYRILISNIVGLE